MVARQQEIQGLKSKLDNCLIRDNRALARKLKQLARQKDEAKYQDGLARLTKRIDESCRLVLQRKKDTSTIKFPQQLPVSQSIDEIRQLIEKNQVVVLCGETGSGKTTQIPKLCLLSGRGVKADIGHTQPRRLAARSVASRIAEELGEQLGDTVGFKVRFNQQYNETTNIKLMTDGILLSEIKQTPLLLQYDTLIIDEAHERSLNIDFILGHIKRILPKRPDLKVIITSATIDPEKFSRHFNDAPVINVSGRTFPVEVRYRSAEDEALSEAIADAVDELMGEKSGDILVFLSGERDIRDAADTLRKKHYRDTEILPLLARLSAREQNRIFHPGNKRRIILATNVAETSLTVPGIRFVIDTGLARISRYSVRSKMQRLPIEKISQAAANQRKGRCGRVAEGICIRLYSEDDYNARAEFTEPEIHRTNLASVLLQMADSGMGEIEDFPFIDPPDERQIRDGVRLLTELHAFDKQGITETGKYMARLPVDPQLARMLVEARTENALRDVLVIVSALAIQDPRERPVDRQSTSDEKHAAYFDKKSDFLFYVNLWNEYQKNLRQLSHSKLRNWCKDKFLSYMRMREWQDVHENLTAIIKEFKWKISQANASYEQVHQSLLCGLLGHVGFRKEEFEYIGARGRKFFIFPGSNLFKKRPKWIMAAEIVETNKVYARCVAQLDVNWLVDKAAHLLKLSYAEPHWEKRQGRVAAYEMATLYGLEIYSRRKVNYAAIDPVVSRELLIRALIMDDYAGNEAFVKHNRDLFTELQTLEAKSRRQDVIADEQILFDFYDERIPHNVCDSVSLKAWWKKVSRQSPDILNMQRDDVMQHGAEHVSSDQFPDILEFGVMKLTLEYEFDPQSQHDGVNLVIPQRALLSVNASRCEWLVPGLLKEKIIALIRSLPKNLRRHFVPVPDYAQACMEVLVASDTPLKVAIAQQLQRMSGITIPLDAWRESLLDDYLLMTFKVLNDAGKVIALSKDLKELQDEYADSSVADRPSALPEGLEKQDIKRWDFGDISEPVEVNLNGAVLQMYYAVSKNGKQVDLKLFENTGLAQQAMKQGVRQLVKNLLADQMRYAKQQLGALSDLCLKYRDIAPCDEIKTELIDRAIDQAFFVNGLPYSSAQFEQCLQNGREQFIDALENLKQQVNVVLSEYASVRKQLKKMPVSWLEAGNDINEQLGSLVERHFLHNLSADLFAGLSRYLKAISMRLQKLELDSQKDRMLRLRVQPYWDKYKQHKLLLEKQGRTSAELAKFRLMIEEFRVSLFAQGLKTSMPVSEKRLNQQWEKVCVGG